MKRMLLVFCLSLGAQERIEAPPLARVLDGEGRLTPVFGLAGNFVRGAAGEALLGFSDDGEIEWRLSPGRLVAVRAGREAVYPTEATRAEFRGATAYLPETGELVRLEGETLVTVDVAGRPGTVAGREIVWRDGQIVVRQADGAETVVDAPGEPEEITAAAADWARLRIGRQDYLLRLEAGRVELFVLPARRRV